MRHRKVDFLAGRTNRNNTYFQAFDSFIALFVLLTSYNVQLLLLFSNLFRAGELICLAVELSWGLATERVCIRGGPHLAKADNE